MLKIGCHLSVAKGFRHMGEEALSIGANVFQYFSRNPRGSKAKKIDEKDVKGLLQIAEDNNFGKLLAHAPYTLNPCSKDEKVREFALMVMGEDLTALQLMPGSLYNFHPGSHTGQGAEKGIELIVGCLNEILKPEHETTVLLETMAGKGSEIGGRFEELKAIMDGVRLKDKIGVCLDTCHVFDGGYDIAGDLDGVLQQFDSIIGLQNLHAIHLNDSMNTLGSHKDRHAKIGEGNIGLEAIVRLINHPLLKELPFYLETPNELSGYAREIKMLKEAYLA